MIDSYGRSITYLRLSVTELCNLRCRYCMPADGVCKKRHEEMLTQEETLAAIRAAASLGVRKLRITGGEPLVKPNIVSLCREAAPENRAGSLSLAGTWALCAGAALFVGPDSGIAHLADLSGTPAAVLFGSGDPAKWGPRHGRAVTAEPPACPCAPCSRYGTLHRRRGCRYECMAGIGAGAVAAAAGALLRCNPSGMERR